MVESLNKSLRRIISRVLVGLCVIAGVGDIAWGQQPVVAAKPAGSTQGALLDRYCVTCHNDRAKTAGLTLEKMDVDKPAGGAEVWEKVIRKLQTGAMPPAGMPRPNQEAAEGLVSYLEASLDRAADAKPNPGRPAPHRLNRAEYTNAIHDLLALDIDGEALLPADDSGYGFDNVADILSLSPMLLDRYMSDARRIARLALGDPTMRTPVSTYKVARLSSQNDRVSEDLPFGSRGGLAVRHAFPVDGTYVFKINLQRAGNSVRGYAEQHHIDVRLDGERVKLFAFGGEDKPLSAGKVQAGLELRIPVTAGPHLIGVTFPSERMEPEGMYRGSRVQLQTSSTGLGSDRDHDPGLENISISGPLDAKAGEDSPSRKMIFVCRPTRANDEEPCARKILTALAHRAYRGPVKEGEIQALLGLYRSGRRRGDFDTGISTALQGILVSSRFLFRIEADPPNASPASPQPVSDIDLASRLSFFLWSSIPDEELLDLAEHGKLSDPVVLEQQTRRMFRDPRSQALMKNFAGQWLLLRNLHSVLPDESVYPDFDENLRQAFGQEMDLFLNTMLREDRSVLDLLGANFTFVNERLARHYGIPNIYGTRFRRVTLTDEARWGLLGKGAILLVTSYPNRTSPVLRGKWVLENLLGTPPPAPPPNVPDLKEDVSSLRLTMRQRMEQHRANPACASCHARMDPIGFALDAFDGIGQFRTVDTVTIWNDYSNIVTRTPLDTSGVLPDGTKFEGPAGLGKVLLSHPEQFITNLTEKLLTYGLGRGVEYYDEPTVRKIIRDAAQNDYRWSALILEIVKSQPFRMKTPADSEAVASAR
jgi:mono/diheme cytochrome c family protein